MLNFTQKCRNNCRRKVRLRNKHSNKHVVSSCTTIKNTVWGTFCWFKAPFLCFKVLFWDLRRRCSNIRTFCSNCFRTLVRTFVLFSFFHIFWNLRNRCVEDDFCVYFLTCFRTCYLCFVTLICFRLVFWFVSYVFNGFCVCTQSRLDPPNLGMYKNIARQGVKAGRGASWVEQIVEGGTIFLHFTSACHELSRQRKQLAIFLHFTLVEQIVRAGRGASWAASWVARGQFSCTSPQLAMRWAARGSTK
jgi:hypothetical protein